MAQAQEINPWSVTGGQAEDGTALAIDYLALSQYVLRFMLSLMPVQSCIRFSVANIVKDRWSNIRQEMEHFADRSGCD